ncbi:MAG: transglutaminaseTgpA domain-containing protein [Acidobacteriota bacterium]
MSAKRRDIELLLLAMLAAVPLYATQTISLLPLLAFHALMTVMVVRVAAGRSPEIIPAPVMRGLAVAYIVFYVIDAAIISRNAIAASTHLILFIALYQPIESLRTKNHMQRLLTASLIFIASVATATHIAIIPFVIAFGFMLFRQLISISHLESAANANAPLVAAPSGRAAGFYVAATTALGMALFPLLPRVRNPLVPGMVGRLSNAATGLSESIDFNEQREILPDATVVSRVWMGPDAMPFFTPLRLRGTLYERFGGNKWLQGRRDFAPLPAREGATQIARPVGFDRRATIQQRLVTGGRLFLPAGTWQVDGPQQIYEGPTRDTFMVWPTRRDVISYDVHLARNTSPLRVRRVPVSNYPVTPPVAAMARQIAGNLTDPMAKAGAIEHYLATRFRYTPNPADIGHTMTVDSFLLQEQRGHCEYFAAGMVALLTAVDVPARIAGGFYGGKLNPLTGYFVVRREDAHAWVEAYDGEAWQTFDPTPPSLRPGNSQDGLVGMYASALSDSINYFWDRYVLTFGLADQVSLAIEAIRTARDMIAAIGRGTRRSAAEVMSVRFGMTLLVVVAAGMVLVWVLRGRHSLFDRLAAHLRALGIEVGASMTMAEALDELRRSRPDGAAALAPLIRLYEEEQFSGRHDRARVRMIRRGLQSLS